MSKRFYYDEFTCDIFDEEIEDYPSNREICATLNYQAERIVELKEQLKNAIVPKFKVGDYFIEYWDKEPSIYQYQGDKHFKCLNKKQGYHCDYVVLGALLLERDFIQPISKEEALAKLKELQSNDN